MSFYIFGTTNPIPDFPLNSSGFSGFPFRIAEAESEPDGPHLALTFLQLIELYWRIRAFTVTANIGLVAEAGEWIPDDPMGPAEPGHLNVLYTASVLLSGESVLPELTGDETDAYTPPVGWRPIAEAIATESDGDIDGNPGIVAEYNLEFEFTISAVKKVEDTYYVPFRATGHIEGSGYGGDGIGLYYRRLDTDSDEITSVGSITLSVVGPWGTQDFDFYYDDVFEYLGDDNRSYRFTPTFPAGGVTITAKQWWPWDPDDGGGPVYDEDTGEQLRDPLTVAQSLGLS